MSDERRQSPTVCQFSIQRAVFNELRQCLENPPVPGHFDEDALTVVHTDAPNVGLGAVLMQCQDGAK